MKDRKCLVIVYSMLLASSAFAQRSSQFDVSGNLSFSGNNSAAITGLPSKQVNAFGWQTSGDSHLNRWLSVTSEFGYASADAADIFGLTSPDSASVHHYSLLGGPRITLPVRGRFTPFVEGLAGWDRATTKATTNGITFTGTDLQTAYAFGGGAQIALNRRISFRVQADYFGSEHSSTFLGWEPSHLRVAGGIVIRVVGPRDPRRLAVERPSSPTPSRNVEASKTEDKVAETVKPVEAQPIMVASVPAPSPTLVAQPATPAIEPTVHPRQQPQPVQSQALAEVSTPAAKTQPATPVVSVAAPPKPANPSAVMAGVVIITPSAQQQLQTRAQTTAATPPPTTVAPIAAPVQQAQAEPEPLSLGEYARRVRARKQQQQ